MNEPLRIGVLGAAKIAPPALVEPARVLDGVEAAGVAARDPARARAFAEEHAIPRVFESYADLVASPDIDCVYNALPIHLHCEWSLYALEEGKHVLCEKAFASNADEAERMAAAARRTGLRLVEAFHWRYHPLAARVLELRTRLGRLETLSAHFHVPQMSSGDIRMQYATGGGATMDLGCYPIHMLRHLVGEEPRVWRAEAEIGPPDVDVALWAELEFPGGARGRIESSMREGGRFAMELTAKGSAGHLKVVNPLAPHIGNRITLESKDGPVDESVEGDSTYCYQLRAFAAAVREGTPVPTDPDDAVANMRVIDACYVAAGLPQRGDA